MAGRARETRAATGAWFPLVAARWIVRREYLVTARPVDATAAAAAAGRRVRWRPIEDPDGRQVARAFGPWDPEEVRRRLREGQECWVGWIDGEAAHWRWESTRPAFLPYLGRALCPREGDLCVVEVYTAPRFRGRGLHTAGTFFALERAHGRSLARLVGLVAWWNDPARRVMEVKTARTVVGSVGFWHLGVARRYFARGSVRLAPEGIVVGAAGRPRAETVPAGELPGSGPG
jgi:hypothetical protein